MFQAPKLAGHTTTGKANQLAILLSDEDLYVSYTWLIRRIYWRQYWPRTSSIMLAGHRTGRFDRQMAYILESRSWRRLPEINKFVAAIGAADHHETSSSKPAVIHCNYPNAEDGADRRIRCIASLFKQLYTDVTTYRAFRSDSV